MHQDCRREPVVGAARPCPAPRVGGASFEQVLGACRCPRLPCSGKGRGSAEMSGQGVVRQRKGPTTEKPGRATAKTAKTARPAKAARGAAPGGGDAEAVTKVPLALRLTDR